MSPICTAPQSESNLPFTIYIYRTWLKHHTLFVQKTTKTAGNFMYSVYMLTRSSGTICICQKSIQEIFFYLIRGEWDFWQKLPWPAPCFQLHQHRNIHMARWVGLSNFDRILLSFKNILNSPNYCVRWLKSRSCSMRQSALGPFRKTTGILLALGCASYILRCRWAYKWCVCHIYRVSWRGDSGMNDDVSIHSYHFLVKLRSDHLNPLLHGEYPPRYAGATTTQGTT